MQLVTWFLSIYPFLNNLPLSLLHVNLIEDNNFIHLIASLCVGFPPILKPLNTPLNQLISPVDHWSGALTVKLITLHLLLDGYTRLNCAVDRPRLEGRKLLVLDYRENI